MSGVGFNRHGVWAIYRFEMARFMRTLVQSVVTIPNILDAIARSNMIDSPGLIEANHQLVLSLVSGQTIDYIPRPGAIAPPCQRPSAETRSTVTAVPHETTSPGPRPPFSPRAPTTARARSAG